MHHPWRRFRELADWTLHIAPLPAGRLADTHWPSLTVTLAPGMLHAQRRSSICHESIHIERGPVPDQPVLAAREEAAVELETARRLIDVRALGEALAWSDHPAVVADELQVDQALLRVRMRHLHPSEKHYLQRRLAEEDG